MCVCAGNEGDSGHADGCQWLPKIWLAATVPSPPVASDNPST